jgi:hypothetical protein
MEPSSEWPGWGEWLIVGVVLAIASAVILLAPGSWAGG